MSDSSDEEEANTKEFKAINNVDGLKEKLKEIQLNLNWVEKLDMSIDLSSVVEKPISYENEKSLDTNAESDFKRELTFYNQALSAATNALSSLKKLSILTRRPVDFFAEMAKSDAHMVKVREKLLSKQMTIERSEKVRTLREQKKHGKKIQQEILQQKQSEKKMMLNALKKTKKGKLSADKLLGDKKETSAVQKRKKSNEFKNSKYGYGGQKKRSKYNTADSSALQSFGKKNASSNGKKQAWSKPRTKKTRRRR